MINNMKYFIQDITSLFNKLISSLKERGFLNTLKAMRHRLIFALRTYVDASFDRHYGTDTAGSVSLKDLYIESESKKDGTLYEPTPVPVIRYMLKQLKIDHLQHTFIDYGSGKGRVLLLASEYPFKKIIGVEFSPELNKIAQKNIKIWKNPRQKCFNIQIICIDACEHDIPNGPVVLFFFTPFHPPVADKVINRIKKDLYLSPRPVRILYYGTSLPMIRLLKSISLGYQDLNIGRPFEALKKYRGILFSSAE